MAELKTFLFTDVVGSVELKREMPGSSDAERDQAFIERILLAPSGADRSGAGRAGRPGRFDGRRRPFSGLFRHDPRRPLGDARASIPPRRADHHAGRQADRRPGQHAPGHPANRPPRREQLRRQAGRLRGPAQRLRHRRADPRLAERGRGARRRRHGRRLVPLTRPPRAARHRAGRHLRAGLRRARPAQDASATARVALARVDRVAADDRAHGVSRPRAADGRAARRAAALDRADEAGQLSSCSSGWAAAAWATSTKRGTRSSAASGP